MEHAAISGGVFPSVRNFSHCARVPCPGKAGAATLRFVRGIFSAARVAGKNHSEFCASGREGPGKVIFVSRKFSEKPVATPFRRDYNEIYFS
ncbi:MAG: hypothetical protein SO100_02965 [Dysosmobacter sp.]|nr:hypothetical protein [Dysosmobacter sp.]